MVCMYVCVCNIPFIFTHTQSTCVQLNQVLAHARTLPPSRTVDQYTPQSSPPPPRTQHMQVGPAEHAVQSMQQVSVPESSQLITCVPYSFNTLPVWADCGPHARVHSTHRLSLVGICCLQYVYVCPVHPSVYFHALLTFRLLHTCTYLYVSDELKLGLIHAHIHMLLYAFCPILPLPLLARSANVLCYHTHF
jgi:hypothetical protein